MADLDIIIVTFNSAQVLLACLNSLAPALPERSIRIILIDNNSSDATAQQSNSFSSNPPHHVSCTLMANDKNVGFTRAINQGLKKSDAPFILILNPDTVLPELGIEKLIAILEKNDSLGIVAPQLLNNDRSIQPSCRRLPKRRDVFFHACGLHLIFSKSAVFNGWKMGDFHHKSAQAVSQPQGAFLLTRDDVVKKVGHLDENFPMFFSDVDWCHRVLRAGYTIRFSPEVAILHHQGQAVNSKRAPMILSSHRSFIRYIWKYGPEFKWYLPNIFVTLLLVISGIVRIGLALILSEKKVGGFDKST
ncbi:MAG: glycosyltransferase family 2 protein [Calditrichaeota bacterium]|nr:MAG: glycosyltransferase family 2 protein [Calditrichota bacterium]